MARFYGSIQGQRGEATRLGGVKSGLTVKAASWQGAIRVSLYANGDVDMVRIEAVQHHGSDNVTGIIYNGPMMSAGAYLAVKAHHDNRTGHTILDATDGIGEHDSNRSA